jgi:serine/threonine-protein kinase
MSQRFFRCMHCGLPHDVMQTVCPATGKPIERRRYNTSSVPAQRDPSAGPSNLPARPRQDSRPPPPVQLSATRHVSTMPPRANRDLIGKTIGSKYLVRSVLGEGGMGSVFEAENIPLGRSVAVKVLHPAQARKKTAVKRFHQEARAAGAIGHPNICEVYDLGTLDDGSPYLVMERLVGETLADRIASEGGLPFEDVIDVLTQVLSGLVAAHEKGIVHRDIKPENVFLTRRVGCPPLAKLLDFGVSKMITPMFGNEKDEDLDLTRTGMVMGTPFYMSPEQARGDRNLDARVDLYACGIMMYEALTGKRPFTAANYNALLLQILTTKPRPARELRPAMPLGFDEVLDKALARNRDERFQTAAAFQRELQLLRDRHPQTAVGMDVSDISRQMQLRKATPIAPIVPTAQRPPPAPAQASHKSTPNRGHPAPPRVVKQPPQIPEPTPSSVEIPVLFSDTPLSGEHFPVEATSVDDLPTEMRERFASSSDSDTTERRADLGHLAIGKRPRAGNLRAPRATTTDKGSKPTFPSSSDTEIDDSNATLVQPSPIPRRKARPSSPDDTIRMDDGSPAKDVLDRLTATPTGDTPVTRPKLPRR